MGSNNSVKLPFGIVLLSIGSLLVSVSNTFRNGNTAIPENVSFDEQVNTIHREVTSSFSEVPDKILFRKAMKGFLTLKAGEYIRKNILTIIDFRLSSTKKRMWVIDLDKKRVLYHTLVAHGKNTGEEFARSFSNIPKSNQSSLGFYLTGNTYFGRNGLSLYLDGIEAGYNGKARDRAIVMHGAEYVSESFIKKYGRLGRSFGCPAVSMNLHKEIISTIKGKSCLFIYYPEESYEKNSQILKGPLDYIVKK